MTKALPKPMYFTGQPTLPVLVMRGTAPRGWYCLSQLAEVFDLMRKYKPAPSAWTPTTPLRNNFSIFLTVRRLSNLARVASSFVLSGRHG